MNALTQQDSKALEQTRQRLFQLTSNLASLQNSIHTSDPLPPWTSLQTTAAILQQNLLSLSQHLQTHSALFSSLAVYPFPAFPAKTQEGLLGQLLRKKLEPHVEDYVDLGRSTATATQNKTNDHTSSNHESTLRLEELEELWDWARYAANQEARKRMGTGAYTLEEREMGIENVVTGLKRKLEDDDSDEETNSDEDEEPEGAQPAQTEGAGERPEGVQSAIFTGVGHLRKEVDRKPPERKGPPLPMEDLFRFMCTGAEPSQSTYPAAQTEVRR